MGSFLHAALRRIAASTAGSLTAKSAGRRACHSSTALFRRGPGRVAPGRLTFGGSRSSSSVASQSDLIRVIGEEIKCAEDMEEQDQAVERPDRFPFEIKDEQGTNNIILTRDFHGENVEVIVSMPSLVTGDENAEDDGDEDRDQQDEEPTQSSIPLIVKVSKGSSGPRLEFCCTAYADEISIDSLSVKEEEDSEEDLGYEGPEFMDLDENLQKAFHKYLEIRGISPATTNFLHEYMLNKDGREYLIWLKKLKNFVEK